MSPAGPGNGRGNRSFPRVSGDEPYGWMEKINLGVFSLRERG